MEKLSATQRQALRQAAVHSGLIECSGLYRKEGGGFFLPQTVTPLVAAGLLKAASGGMLAITAAGRAALAGRRAG